MNAHLLAAQLRERQLANKRTVYLLAGDSTLPYREALAIARQMVETVSDEGIIDSYVRCSGCGELMVDPETTVKLIWRAHSAAEWIALAGEWARRHAEGERRT